MHLSISASIGGIAGVVPRGHAMSPKFDCGCVWLDADTIAYPVASMKSVARFRMALSGAGKAIE